MPRKPASKKSETTPRDTRRAEILREARLLGAAAFLILLLVSLLAYDPTGRPGGLVGAVGNFLARWTFWGFGLTAFLVVPLGMFWLGVVFFRKDEARPWERALGMVLVTVAMSAALSLAIPSSRYVSLAEGGPGGHLGILVRDSMVYTLGSVGAFLTVLILFLVGMAFFTDWLVFEMAADAAGLVRSAGPVFKRLLWPEAALATATAAPAAPTRRKKVEEPPVFDDPTLDEIAEEQDDAEAEDAESEDAEPKAEKLSLKDRLFGKRKKKAEEPVVDPAVREEEPLPDLELAPLDGEEEVDDEVASLDDDGPAEPELDADPAPAVVPPPMPRPKPTRKSKKAKKRKARPNDGDYEFPPTDLLDRPKIRETRSEEDAIQGKARVLEQTLSDFRIDAQVVGYTRGPVVTMFEISLAAGIKAGRIQALADDLAMAMKAQTVRVVYPLPGRSTVGVEVPNPTRDDVRMLGLMETETFQNSDAAIPVLVGVDAVGANRIEDLAKMPHLLIAGATGAGKSVCINSIIMSILMTRTPSEVRMILVDPKQVELSFFAKIPHLLAPVVTDMKRATSVLEWACVQMDERYDLLAKMQVRSIASYNELGEKKIHARCKEENIDDQDIPVTLPYVVIVVDELADLMMTAGKEVEVLITRLAQKSRAVGIHVVLATQRPSTDVITGLIKANMPTRICFKVTSKVDSRVVMDQNGGDKLLGQGDMLYLPPRSANLLRAQATFVADGEVKRVVEFLSDRHEPRFNRELTQVCNGSLLSEDEKDPLYDKAVRIVLEEQRGSASLLQRMLEVGYTRASRLLDLMRKEGIVGAYRGSKASEVMMNLDQYEARVAAAREARVHAADEDDFEEEFYEDDEDIEVLDA